MSKEVLLGIIGDKAKEQAEGIVASAQSAAAAAIAKAEAELSAEYDSSASSTVCSERGAQAHAAERNNTVPSRQPHKFIQNFFMSHLAIRGINYRPF